MPRLNVTRSNFFRLFQWQIMFLPILWCFEPKRFFSDFENFLSPTPQIFTPTPTFHKNCRLFWWQIMFLPILWCFEPKRFFSYFESFLSPTPQIFTPQLFTKFLDPDFSPNFFRLFQWQIMFLPLLWCFKPKSFFSDFESFLSPNTPNFDTPTFHQIFFDFFSGKSCFCPFYDVLSQKGFFQILKMF